MDSQGVPVGAWYRVSTGGQDEDNQTPDVERHCQDRGYAIVHVYQLNDKSASKGEQQAKLDEMIEDMREGTIKKLVCWHSDRVERRGPEHLFRLLRQIRDAGGCIESTKEPLFGTEDLSGEAVTALGAVMAHQYSVHLAEQVKAAHDRSRGNDAIYAGQPVFGYILEGPKYNKKYVATDLGREIIPQIFDRCIAGESLRQIAEWLDSQGIPTARGGKKWNESVVRRIIRNRAYAGRVQNRQGVTMSHCEALVSADVFDRANEALKTRPKRGPTNNDNRPLLAKLKCARCGSPMYRRRGGWKQRYCYYACSGSGPQRKGCGNLVPFEHTETIIIVRIFLTSNEPHTTRTWVEGKNWDAEISDIMQDIRELPQKEDPLSDTFDARMKELKSQLADYRNRETIPGRWDEEETGMTVGEYFYNLNAEDRREYLKTRDIRVEKVTPTDVGAIHGIRIVIDGQDHGIFPHPPLSRPRVTTA